MKKFFPSQKMSTYTKRTMRFLSPHGAIFLRWLYKTKCHCQSHSKDNSDVDSTLHQGGKRRHTITYSFNLERSIFNGLMHCMRYFPYSLHPLNSLLVFPPLYKITDAPCILQHDIKSVVRTDGREKIMVHCVQVSSRSKSHTNETLWHDTIQV